METKIWGVCILLIGVIISVVLSVGCSKSPPQNVMGDGPYEITETDILAFKGFNASKVTVKGVKLGDPMDSVVGVLGQPDYMNMNYSNEGILNFEYGKSLGLAGIGLIFHTENNVVTRITVLQAFNPLLHGSTVINMTKGRVYGRFGIPDTQTDTVFHRIFVYEYEGLEFYVKNNNQIGFSLVQPKV